MGEMTFDTFVNDPKTVDAVIRNLIVIGEAAKGIPEDIRQQSQEVAWQKIVGLKNILTHRYFGIDLEIIWDIVQHKLSFLEREITRILQEPESSA